MKKKLNMILFMACMIISFVLLSFSSTLILDKFQFDLTAENKFTLSKASKQLIKSLEMPLFITVYVSPELTAKDVKNAEFTKKVLTFIEKYKIEAEDRVFVTVKEASPYTDNAQEAKKLGLKEIKTTDKMPPYFFGAHFALETGVSSVVSEFSPKRENYLQQDISKAIEKLFNPKSKKIGIVSPNFTLIASGKNKYTNLLVERLAKDYQLEVLPNEMAEVPLDIDVLILVNPDFTDIFTYALDQFAMRGKPILLFLDNMTDSKQHKKEHAPLLNEFLNVFDLSFNTKVVLADEKNARYVMTKKSKGVPVKNVFWMEFDTDDFDKNNIIMNSINKIKVNTPGALKVLDDRVMSLAFSSDKSGMVSNNVFKTFNVFNYMDFYRQGNEKYVWFALAEHRVLSMYEEQKYNTLYPFLSMSVTPPKLAVVADVDLLFLQEPTNFDFIERVVHYLAENNSWLRYSPQQSKFNLLPIQKVIDKSTTAKESAKILMLETQLRDLEMELRQEYAYASAENLRQTINNAEQIQREIQHKSNQLQYLNFTIEKKATQIKNMIIIAISVVVPLIMVLLLFVINKVIFMRRKKIIERKINV